MKMPKKITPCPLAEAIVEIRFESSTAKAAVFGMVFTLLREKYPSFEPLPITQIPESLRDSQQDFQFKPHYVAHGPNFIIQIGSDVITVSSPREYVGWSAFSKEVLDVWRRLNRAKVVSRVLRLGVRYINFFDRDVYDIINLKILLNDEKMKSRQTYILSHIPSAHFINQLQITNNASVHIKGKDQADIGSIIDIDTYAEDMPDNFFSQAKTLLNNAHQEEKKLFFSLLSSDFLSSLNPEY